MAEAVKNNGRKRRPPSHLRQGYNQDNFEPPNTQYLGSREPYRQGADPCSMIVLAKLLTKFMNSSNKKFLEAQSRKAEQEVSPPPAKTFIQNTKYSIKQEKIAKQERQSASSKIVQNSGGRQTGYRHESNKHQQRLPRYSSIPSSSHPINQSKQGKNQTQIVQSTMKSALISGNKPNFDSLNKMSREQFLKMMPKGYDPNLWREQLLSNSDFQTSKIFGKLSQNLIKPNLQNTGANQFRQGTKLFKRASFHVGIAYNIHIENIRQRNPNFGPEQLDPTYVSRKLKQQNSEIIKKQNQQNERLRLQQQMLFKQKQQEVWEAAMMRQRQQQLLNQLSVKQQTPNKKQNSINEPICIDDEDQGHKMQAQKIQQNDIQPKIQHKQEAIDIGLKQQINPEAIIDKKENGQVHQDPKQIQFDIQKPNKNLQTPKGIDSQQKEKSHEQI